MVRWELDWLANRVRLTPNAEAIVDAEENKSWTYAELEQLCVATAGWLYNHGVRKGDRVALLSPNDISYFQLLLACGKLGAVFVPVNWRLSHREIHYILADCTPKLIGYHSSFEEQYGDVFKKYQTFKIDNGVDPLESEIPEVTLNERDPLAIIYTGGTTGNPKGVVLSHQSIIWNGINTIISWNLSSQDITLTYMPLFHTGGLNALSIPLLMIGGKVVIGRDFYPERAIHFLNYYQCTIVLFVPTMYQMMIETEDFRKNRFPTIHTFLSGGAPCPLEIYQVFKSKGLCFKEGYGLTEAGPNNFYIDPNVAMEKLGSVGKPMMFNDIKLVKEKGEEAKSNEVGEVLIKGKHSFEYYWNNEVATMKTFKEGWLHTGDLAKRDEEGYYFIVGRKKEMIITGGENVYPLEVEHWIASHSQVEEVAVVGIPDQKWGEIVAAFVVLKSDGAVSSEELKEYCSYKLGRYKIPKVFSFLNELPKTHVGKIDKKQLKEVGMGLNQ